MRHLLATVAVIGLACGASAQERRLPEGVKVERDVSYGPNGERNTLDIYLPPGGVTKRPTVLWIHGGGWRGGSKANPPLLPLLADGFVVASANYRFAPAATFPAQIHDCKAAVRFLRANADKYGIDPDRIGVAGASAGGHLAALLGTTGGDASLEAEGQDLNVSSAVQAVCDIFGPTDLPRMDTDGASARPALTGLIGGPLKDDPDKAKLASPITHVTKDAPPFLIVHGDADEVVPVEQSEIFHAALKKAGVDSTLTVIEGAGHGPGVYTPQTIEQVVAFFRKHLKGD